VTDEVRLQKLQPSRKRLRPGDVFCMLPADGRYVFGRVIEVDIPFEENEFGFALAPMPESNLIYVYDARAQEPEPPWEQLRRDRLLLPPMFINRLPWSRGYLQTVSNRPLEPADVLEEHCFRDEVFGRLYDLGGRPRSTVIEPCGTWGLKGYGGLDRIVHEALALD
jgi:hypothetical protein